MGKTSIAGIILCFLKKSCLNLLTFLPDTDYISNSFDKSANFVL